MRELIKTIKVKYDNYVMTESIYSDKTFAQVILNKKTNNVLFPNNIDGVFQSSSIQLRRYLKYLVDNRCLAVAIESSKDEDDSVECVEEYENYNY